MGVTDYPFEQIAHPPVCPSCGRDLVTATDHNRDCSDHPDNLGTEIDAPGGES